MKLTIRKILAFMLTVAMLVSLVTINAIAETETTLLCGTAGSVLGWRLVHRRLEVDIAKPTSAALCNDCGLARFRYVSDEKPRVDIIHLGAERHGHNKVLAALSVPLLPLSGTAVLCEALGIVEKGEE